MIARASVSIALVFSFTSAFGGAPGSTAAFSNIAKKLEAAYDAKDVAGVARYYATNLRSKGIGGDRYTRSELVQALRDYFQGVGRVRVQVSMNVQNASRNNARVLDTTIFRDQVSDGGKTTNRSMRSRQRETWKLTASGWKTTQIEMDALDYQGPDGKWRSSPFYESEIDAEPDGGPGPAPVAVFRKIFDKVELAFSDKDLKALSVYYDDHFSGTDADGSHFSKDDVLDSLRSLFEKSKSINYTANYALVDWTSTTAQVTSMRVLDCTIPDKGQLAHSIFRQKTIGWWSLSPGGWKMNQGETLSTEYADAQMHWHAVDSKQGGKS